MISKRVARAFTLLGLIAGLGSAPCLANNGDDDSVLLQTLSEYMHKASALGLLSPDDPSRTFRQAEALDLQGKIVDAVLPLTHERDKDRAMNQNLDMMSLGIYLDSDVYKPVRFSEAKYDLVWALERRWKQVYLFPVVFDAEKSKAVGRRIDHILVVKTMLIGTALQWAARKNPMIAPKIFRLNRILWLAAIAGLIGLSEASADILTITKSWPADLPLAPSLVFSKIYGKERENNLKDVSEVVENVMIAVGEMIAAELLVGAARVALGVSRIQKAVRGAQLAYTAATMPANVTPAIVINVVVIGVMVGFDYWLSWYMEQRRLDARYEDVVKAVQSIEALETPTRDLNSLFRGAETVAEKSGTLLQILSMEISKKLSEMSEAMEACQADCEKRSTKQVELDAEVEAIRKKYLGKLSNEVWSIDDRLGKLDFQVKAAYARLAKEPYRILGRVQSSLEEIYQTIDVIRQLKIERATYAVPYFIPMGY